MCESENLKLLKDALRVYPDFPNCGVNFVDIFSITCDAKKLALLVQIVLDRVSKICPKPDCILGIDSRGFLVGPLIAAQLKVPFVPIRKKGKLLGKVQHQDYKSEYNDGTLEIQEESIKPNWNVLVTDDLLATGGTLSAGCELIKKLKANPTSVLVLIEIPSLKGRCKLPCEVKTCDSLFQYD